MPKTNSTILGDRMKSYEASTTSRRVFKGQPLVMRLDGKSFHTFTKGLARPYDERLIKLMQETMIYLVDRFDAKVGYTQSDEITLIWYIPTSNKSEYIFDGRLQKFESLIAASCSVFFNKALSFKLPEKKDAMPIFDARAFVVPTLMEALNNLIWRQQDATKNAISMAAQSYYSFKQLHKKNGEDMQKMLLQKGIDFNDYPAAFKRGTFARRVRKLRTLTPEELTRIPEKHRPVPDAKVERSTVELFDVWINKEEDKIIAVFGSQDT